MTDLGSYVLNLVKELTLKAMETGLIKADREAANKSEESAKAVATFYNTLLESLKH
jgi:hypothetical protein